MTATALTTSLPITLLIIGVALLFYSTGVIRGRELERKRLHKKFLKMKPYEESYGVQQLTGDYFEGYFKADADQL